MDAQGGSSASYTPRRTEGFRDLGDDIHPPVRAPLAQDRVALPCLAAP